MVSCLLEQGANKDKADKDGWTPLHWAARKGHLAIAKLLMSYGADLNAREKYGRLPIRVARTEEIEQAIRDEPQRRQDLPRPRKRCVEQDQHPDTAASSASAQQQDEVDGEGEQSNRKLSAEGEAKEGEVADEDQDSEPSSDEDGN